MDQPLRPRGRVQPPEQFETVCAAWRAAASIVAQIESLDELRRFIAADPFAYYEEVDHGLPQWDRLDAVAEYGRVFGPEMIDTLFLRPTKLQFLAGNPNLTPEIASRLRAWCIPIVLQPAPEETSRERSSAFRTYQNLAKARWIDPEDPSVALLLSQMYQYDGCAYPWNRTRENFSFREDGERRDHWQALIAFPSLPEPILLGMEKACQWVGLYHHEIAHHPAATPAVWRMVFRKAEHPYNLRTLAGVPAAYAVPEIGQALFDYCHSTEGEGWYPRAQILREVCQNGPPYYADRFFPELVHSDGHIAAQLVEHWRTQGGRTPPLESLRTLLDYVAPRPPDLYEGSSGAEDDKTWTRIEQEVRSAAEQGIRHWYPEYFG